MERQGVTALIVPVAEVAFVQPFRVAHMQRMGVSMPPHVTLHAPFRDAGQVDGAVVSGLARFFASHSSFSFTLARTARFGHAGVLYLVPEPAEPFLALSRAIQIGFPDTPSDHPDPVIHLTLAGAESDELDRIEEQFWREYGHRFPVEARAAEVCLYVRRGDGWTRRACFALAGGDNGS